MKGARSKKIEAAEVLVCKVEFDEASKNSGIGASLLLEERRAKLRPGMVR